MKQKVLYVMGYARIGSTALGSLLGTHPDVFAAGELSNILDVSGSQNDYCSCGRPVAACVFWKAVTREWERMIGSPATSHCNVPASFKRDRLTYRPRIAATSDDWHRYVAQTASLFRAIRQCSGKSIVLDSSKCPLRALALSRIEDIELSIVHLVRDVRGVALSLSRDWDANPRCGIASPQRGRSLAFTALDWLRGSARANQVRQMLRDRSILVRYEDFVDRPREIIGRICALIGADAGELIAAIGKECELTPGHQMAGNRIRMEGAIRLDADYAWRSELSWPQKFGIWLLASPAACTYGYSP